MMTKRDILRAQLALTAVAIAAEQIRAPAGAKDAEGNSIGGRWVDKDQIYTVEKADGGDRVSKKADEVVAALTPDKDAEVAYAVAEGASRAVGEAVEGVKREIPKMEDRADSRIADPNRRNSVKRVLDAMREVSNIVAKKAEGLISANPTVEKLVKREIPALVRATVDEVRSDPLKVALAAGLIGAAIPVAMLGSTATVAIAASLPAGYGLPAMFLGVKGTVFASLFVAFQGFKVAASVVDDIKEGVKDKQPLEEAKADLEEAAALAFKIPEDVLGKPPEPPEPPKLNKQPKPAPEVREPTSPAPEVREPTSPAPEVREPTSPAPEVREPTSPAPEVREPTSPAPDSPPGDDAPVQKAEPPEKSRKKPPKTQFEMMTGISERQVKETYDRLKARSDTDAEFFMNRIETLKQNPAGSVLYRVNKGIVDAEFKYGADLDRFLEIAGDRDLRQKTDKENRGNLVEKLSDLVKKLSDEKISSEQKKLEKDYDRVLDGSMSVEEFMKRQGDRKRSPDWVQDAAHYSEVDSYRVFLGRLQEGKRGILGGANRAKSTRGPLTGEMDGSIKAKDNLPWWRQTPEKERLESLRRSTDDALRLMRATPDIWVALEEFDGDRDSRLSVAEKDAKYADPLAGLTRGFIGNKQKEIPHPDKAMLTISMKPHPGTSIRHEAFRAMGQVAEMQTESMAESLEYTRIRNRERVSLRAGKSLTVGGALNGEYTDSAANEVTTVDVGRSRSRRGEKAVLATGVVSTAVEKMADPQSLRELATKDREHLMYALHVLDKPDARRKLF